MPNFWQGLLNILIFSVWLGWLPASGFGGWKYWVLPALTIGTSSSANIMRMTRSTMLEVVRQDYIRTARAKGQTERVIRYHHALRNAMIPIVTVIGNSFGSMLSGAVITESIFAIAGLGKLLVDAINVRNYPMVQGCVLFIALIHAVVNLAVDLLYAFIDPRIKSQYSAKTKKSKRVKEIAND
ncbi:Glutathione transport system permease protein GsiC [bioreactor metagenome]|uniref:Glutathione transport system permease protein GsiC n=1 Tax=bioreactor metagenome TaxID=1076179 RepID=A0A645IBG6_9ZZZZ